MKRVGKLPIITAVVSATALLLAGCSSGDEDAGDTSEKTEVSVAVLGPGSLQWLHAIAKSEGYYADHGVKTKDVQVQNSGALVQAVASGSANTGIALGDNVIKAVDKGADIQITGALIQKPALRLYGGAGVDKVGDLKASKVTAGATEGGTYDLLLYMLKEAGVSAETLTPVSIANSSDRVTALKNKEVDGALLIPPFDTLAEDAGATELGWYDHYWLETPAIVNGAWADSNQDGAKGFTQGLQDAAKFFADPTNEEACVDVLKEYADVDEDAAQNAYDFISENDIFSSDLSVPSGSLEEIAKISAAISGDKLDGFDESKYVSDEYLD